MLNSLRDGQINYGTTNCPSAHVPPHNVTPIHQNSLISTEPTTPVYQWNSNHRLEHLYGFHSRYYNLDFPTPYPPTTNQYVPANVYGQNLPQCCQPCCRLRSQNIPKASPPQVLYNPRPVQQLNRSYKSKKTLKTPCSEQFLPYIPNDLPIKYDTQNCYQQKYNSSYLNNTNYCPPANNLWIPPAANPTWPTDRLRPIGRHNGMVSHDFSREKNYQRLPNYQSNPYSKPISATHHIPYNYIPPIPDLHDYRPPVNHNPLKNNTSEYVLHNHSSRVPISSKNIQNSSSSLQQYFNSQSVPYSDLQRPSESFKPPQNTSKSTSKSNLNVREFLATWDEGEDEIGEKSSEVAEPIVVLDCMTLDGDALTKIQEKLNVVSYENLEKVLKENQNPLIITTERNEMNSLNHKAKIPSKSNFEPLDYTKRETGIIKPFITEKKRSPETISQSEKSYSVNFDGMVAWYGKKNTDISSTDLIEKLADRIFNLSKSQENEGVSFGTAAYTGQITQTNRSFENSDKNTTKYIQNPQMFDLQNHADKFIEPPIMNKISCDNDSISRTHYFVLDESDKASTIKSNNVNSSCIVENITKKCLNVINEEITPWNLDQGAQEQHLNTSLYDHSVIMKPLDFSSLTDETKGNPFGFEKNTSSNDKPNSRINNQCNKVFNENNCYNSTVSNNQHSIQQVDSSNRHFPVIVSPHRQEYNGFHESVIQRTGCDKNKHDKLPTRTDFESINWNLSNDLDKIMKNTVMEPSYLYDRNNYNNMLDSINTDKNVCTPWKDNVPCVDLTVHSKTNPHHDSFFDGWSFIESYENHASKKIMNSSSNDDTHNPLFSNQNTSLEESTKNDNICGEKIESETLVVVKDMPPFSKSMDLSPTSRQSRDVFNLNNRIPDFIDGFELPVINEPHEYLQFKKDDNEHRTDGSIFEHLNEPKCMTTLHETLNYKNDQNKFDFVGLSSFKEKEPLAPVSAPSKLNIVKPILRDPSQMYSVIKQKNKYDHTCVENDRVISNKTGNNSREHLTNTFNVTDLKSKYNSVQLNQFDVWSEKFVLKGNSNSSSSSVVQCDVEITQFKSTPENRNTLITKSNICENYPDKTTKLPENKNFNLATDKINIIENDKINSNDFLNCLESTKTDDQKYGDTFDEFETSFGFDIHCNNESNKSFNEDIVDKCFEESIKDRIGGQDLNTVKSTNTTSSKSTQLPFQCDFQSSYLTKNYFDENKNKTGTTLDRKRTSNHEKSSTTDFNFHDENRQELERRNNETIHAVKNSDENSDLNMDCDVGQIQNRNEHNNSNFINEIELFESNHENANNNRKISSRKNNNFNYLSIENSNFGFENSEKSILESTNSNETIVLNNSTEPHGIEQIKHSDLNNHKLFHIRKHSNVDFELNINNSDIFESNSTSIVRPTENDELESDKMSFESKFNSKNVEKVQQNINNTNYFELDNNNSDIYHTQNSVKIDEFDFETRIIQNFDIECSTVDVDKAIVKNKIFTNESQIKTNCGFEINNSENKVQQETNCKSTLGIEETLDLNCNNDPQCHNVIETENINQEKEVNRILEVGCIVNNVQEKLNLENPSTHNDFDIQRKNTKQINLNNCNDNENSNLSNNSDVETIFENMYDKLSTLDTLKNGNNIFSASVGQRDLKYDVSGSLEITEDLNLKNNNSDVVEVTNMQVLRVASNETFEEADNILIQDSVSNSADQLQQNESINDEKSKSTLIEYGTENSNKKLTNIVDNPAMSVEKHTEDIKQGEIESIDEKNRQTINNLTSNTDKGEATLEIFKNLKYCLLNSVKNTDNADGKKLVQNNDSESSLLNSVELTSQRNSNTIDETEDSTNSRYYNLNHIEMVHHQNSHEIIEIGDLTSFRSSLFTQDKLISQQRSDEIVEAIDLTSSGPSSLNNEELMFRQPTGEIDKAENLTSSGTISVNCNDSTPQQNPNPNVEIVDSIRSINSNELISKQNSNEIYEVDDSIICEPSLFNPNKLTLQPHPDEMLEVKYLNSSGPSLINQDELTYEPIVNKINEVEPSTSSINLDELDFQHISNVNNEVEKSTSSRPSLINQEELKIQHGPNTNDEADDLISPGPRSMKQDEFESLHESNQINEVEKSISSKTSSINQEELEFPHNSNKVNEVDESTGYVYSLINQDKIEFQANPDEIYRSEYLTSSLPISINQNELECQQNSKEMYEAEDLTSSGFGSINQGKLEFQQNSNEIYDAGDMTRSGPSSINQEESEFQHNSNEINKVEESTSSGPSLINQEKLKIQHVPNKIDKADDLISPGPSITNQNELIFQNHLNENDEAVDLTISRLSLFNHMEFKSHRNSDHIVEDQDSVGSVGSLSNYNELICRDMIVEPSYLKSSVVSEHNIHETNYDSCINNIDSKNVIDEMQVPRVKFTLKCQSRSMIKTNIFDEDSTVPYKKIKALKDEKFMTRHIFKKRNVCYKPWRSIYRKQSIIDPRDGDLKESFKTTLVLPTSIHTDDISKDDTEIVSLPNQLFDRDEERDDKVLNTFVGIGGDKINCYDDNIFLDTPMPSPFDDFQSENPTPEHCGVDEYWDKSLEDEYKSVLQKTISKLSKVRANIRDKFNSRSLARRINETKRQNRQKQWRQRQLLLADKTAVVIVDRVEDPVEPVVSAVKETTSPVYKIKVQLPWGRIFNLKEGVRNKTKNTKIELGPAKVDVRLSRTPGEWQVAACRSTTYPKSVVVVRRLVLQRATCPLVNDRDDDDDNDVDDDHHNDDDCGTSDNRPQEPSRKLPKIVIRRNGQDNNYTSYVRSSGFECGGGGDVPQLTVRLVRDRRLDAMAIEGITTLHLKHLVPLSESEAAADLHSAAKRVRYS